MTEYTESTEGTPIPWWLVLLQGIAAVIIGIFLLTAPGITLLFLVQVLGFFWLIGGILGLVLLFNPLIGAAVLPFLLGALGLVGGIAAIVGAFAIRRGSAGQETREVPGTT